MSWVLSCPESPTPDRRSIFGVSIDPADRTVSLVEMSKAEYTVSCRCFRHNFWRRTPSLVGKFDSHRFFGFKNNASYLGVGLDSQVVWFLLEVCRCGSYS
jgi:hypothetical protein